MKYRYPGMPKAQKEAYKAALVKQIERPTNMLHSTSGSAAARAQSNSHRDAMWERHKKQRLKEVEESIETADSVFHLYEFALPKGEAVEINPEMVPAGKPRERLKAKLKALVDQGVLEEVKDSPKPAESPKQSTPKK